MTEQEKCVRVTRTMKKRAAAATAEDHSAKKNRVVLGELPNLSNIVAPVNTNTDVEQLKPKRVSKTTAKKKGPETAPTNATKQTDKELSPKSKSDDPQPCGQYASDIHKYLRKMEMEPKRRPLPDFLEKVQKDVTANMRGILVDWLVEVADEYKLHPDTLYLCISYVDRFLSFNAVNKQKLQLLGVSSMLIASKYEETSPPSVDDFCYITDNTYTKDEVLTMEAEILKSLKFEMGNPTLRNFLRKFTDIAQESDNTPNLQLEFLVYYLGELSLLDYNCVKFVPSLVAASVTFLAKFIIQPESHPWCPTLQKYSGYKAADLKECVLNIHDLYLSRRGGSLQAVREKYKQHKFKCVATMPSPPEIPTSCFEDQILLT